MKPRVTQKDVALKAGVSHVAVSLALRGHRSIPEATRKRIKQIARQLGYVPDPMLSGLSAYRLSRRPVAYQSNLAWLNCWPVPKEMHDGDFGDYYVAAVQRARELGYNLEEIRMADLEHDTERLGKVLCARGISGILLPPARHAGAELEMDFSSLSAVRFGYSYRKPVLHTVANAQFRTAFATIQNLTKLGYRRIGFFLDHDQDDRTGWNLLGGFVTGQKFIPRSHRISPFYYEQGDVAALTKWIKRNRLDAVMGLRGWREIKATRCSVGYADLSLNRSDPGDKNVSGMYQNSGRIGEAAVDFLVGMMLRGETGVPDMPIHLFIESIWSPGTTAVQLNEKASPPLRVKS